MSPSSPSTPAGQLPRPKGGSLVRRALCVLCLGGAAALGALAVRLFFRSDSVHATVALAAIDDAKELAARRRDVIGTFATGNAPGDRVIVVRADGAIEFSELGADPATSRTTDKWELLRREKKFALGTTRSGVVGIINIDTLEYFGDTYRRAP